MLIDCQKQLETPSPCRPYPPQSTLSASHLTAQGSPTSQAAKIGSPSQQRKAELFSRFDVRETSFHVYTGRIDLHLCDDASPGKLSSFVGKQTSFGCRGVLHCVSKNIPPLTCYNLDVHDPVTIIFGGSVTEKVRNQTMLFSHHLSSAFALPCKI